MKHYISVEFLTISECQAPPRKRKAPLQKRKASLLKICWRRFWVGLASLVRPDQESNLYYHHQWRMFNPLEPLSLQKHVCAKSPTEKFPNTFDGQCSSIFVVILNCTVGDNNCASSYALRMLLF